MSDMGRVMEQHYAGDDTDAMVLAAGILAAYDGISVEDFEAQADAFLRNTTPRSAGATSKPPTGRCSICSTTSARTGSATTSPPAAAATSCA